jgi:hypothetical protein
MSLILSNRAKLFHKYKEMTDAARDAVSLTLKPFLMGLEAHNTNEHIEDLYFKWQKACRESADALNLYQPQNETSAMPTLPPNSVEFFSCRRFWAILIERNLFGDHVAGKHLNSAIKMEMINKSCMHHPSTCACKLILDGWMYEDDGIATDKLRQFYKIFESIDLNSLKPQVSTKLAIS